MDRKAKKASSDLERYPRPSVAVDVVALTVEDAQLHVAVYQRGSAPQQGRWALPGGFMDIDESIDEAAFRVVEQKVGLRGVFLEQLFTFGNLRRDPRGRVVTVAYYALVESHHFFAPKPQPGRAGSGTPLDPKPQPGRADSGTPLDPKPQPGRAGSGTPLAPKPQPGRADSGTPLDPKPQPGRAGSGTPLDPKPQPGRADSGTPLDPKPQPGRADSGTPLDPKPQPGRGVTLARVAVPWRGESGGRAEAIDDNGRKLPLFLDHADILGLAVKRLRGKLDYTTVGFQLLPKEFTLRQLQEVHEAIRDERVNKDSFRRRMLASSLLVPTGNREADVVHRPAELYRFTKKSAT